MKKYFYSDGVDKFGPYTIDELHGKMITKDTKVWYEGLGEWQTAGSLPELNDLFRASPPPISTGASSSYGGPLDQQHRPPKNWLVESILSTLFCCLPFGIAGIVNAAKVESRYYAGDIEGANRAAADAKKWTMISFWIGFAFIALYIVFIIFAAVAGDL